MAWHGKGADRVKRFQVYQELEARYNKAVEEKSLLQAEIARKDDVIRSLAAELASQVLPPELSSAMIPEVAAEVRKASERPSRPAPRQSTKLAIKDVLEQIEAEKRKQG